MPLVVVVGRPLAGKTLFTLGLARQFGIRRVSWPSPQPGAESVSVAEARRRVLQAGRRATPTFCIPVGLGQGRNHRVLTLMDTAGLTDGIARHEASRRAMADVLDTLQRADIVLHVVDAAAPGIRLTRTLDPVDRALRDYARTRPAYALVAHKWDRVEARRAWSHWERERDQVPLLTVSSLRGQGFRAVQQFVLAACPPR